MSTDDLSILADALTFALLVTIGGLVVWGVVRATWRRPALRRAMKVCLSAAALVAVGLAGVALWPAARQGVTTAAGAAGIDVARDASPTGFEDRDLGDPELVPSSPRGRTARVFEASTTSDGGVLLVPSPFSDPGQGSGSGAGSGSGSGSGSGVAPPGVDPGSPPGGGGGSGPPSTQPPPPSSAPPPPPSEPPPPPPPPPTETQPPPPSETQPPPPSETQPPEPEPSPAESPSVEPAT